MADDRRPGCPEVATSQVRDRRKRLLPLIVCCSIPVILLTAAYIRMCFFYKTIWLFDTPVHENGKYTFLQVIFYFRHFSWELLGKVVYSFYIVGTFYFYGKPVAKGNGTGGLRILRKKILVSGIVASAIIAASVLATVNAVGFKEAVTGLLQYRRSEVRPPEFGSHWRNHLLSTIVLFSASAFSVLLYRSAYWGGNWTRRRFGKLLPISVASFLVLTCFFGLTKDPFDTPSYLGHQLREIFGSDLPITMLSAMAVLIYLEGKYDSRELYGGRRSEKRNALRHLMLWALPVVLISCFLIVKVMSLDVSGEIASLESTKDWTVLDLFAWHFYEHTLDYLFVISFVYFLYLLALRLEFRKTRSET